MHAGARYSLPLPQRPADLIRTCFVLMYPCGLMLCATCQYNCQMSRARQSLKVLPSQFETLSVFWAWRSNFTFSGQSPRPAPVPSFCYADAVAALTIWVALERARLCGMVIWVIGPCLRCRLVKSVPFPLPFSPLPPLAFRSHTGQAWAEQPGEQRLYGCVCTQHAHGSRWTG